MRLCENCYRRHWRAKINKNTGVQVKHKNGNKVFICIKCGHVQEEEVAEAPRQEQIEANILYIDIETSKSMYYSYGAKVRSKYLNPDDLIREWFMISWAASYVGNDKVWSEIVTPQKALEWNDNEIVYRLHELMDSAEIIAGHNVDGFDLKRVNTRFMKHGLSPITGKKTIDTLKLCRSKLALESNRLDFVSKWFGILGKDDVTNKDWHAVLQGDKKTLDKVIKYNIGDVVNGKNVLLKLLPIANKKQNFGALKKTPPAMNG